MPMSVRSSHSTTPVLLWFLLNGLWPLRLPVVSGNKSRCLFPRRCEIRQMGARAILAVNIKRLRAVRDLSQEALADLGGLHRTYVSALERERYAASIDTIERLAGALQCRLVDLLAPDELDAEQDSRFRSPTAG